DKIDTYVDILRKNRQEAEALYQDLLINVTGFFRDPDAFQTLKTKIFPQLIKNRSEDRPIRIWVPACSTGQEVYSIAISLVEFLTERKQQRPVQIFGTDIHDSALEKARAGVFTKAIEADISAERMRRFFQKTEDGYRVNKS